jgi:hypothetical protein
MQGYYSNADIQSSLLGYDGVYTGYNQPILWRILLPQNSEELNISVGQQSKAWNYPEHGGSKSLSNSG